MKILIVTQVFVPDMYANALLSGALCSHLLQQGHDVSVLAGPASDTTDRESQLARDVESAVVYRAPGVHTKKRGLGRRVASFARLYGSVLRHAMRARDYDVVIALTLPPLIYVPALLFRYLSRARVMLWCMDCYPEVAVESAMIRRGGAVHRALAAVNRWCLPKLDGAIALDTDMARHLAHRGVRRIETIPNWESEKDYVPLTDEERAESRRRLRLDLDDLVLLYLGNIGIVHEFDSILEALRAAARPEVKLVFVGDGARRSEIEAFRDRHGLSQIRVHEFLPKSKTRLALGACDLGLVTLRREMVGLVTPSKIYGYLAMAVPLLFVGPRASEVGRTISAGDCGHVFEPGEVPALRDYLRSLPTRRDELRIQGARGAEYFRRHFAASIVLPQFDRLLTRARFGEGRSRAEST